MGETGKPGRRVRVGELASYALTAGAVALAWQIVVQPFAQRAPVEAAVRIAPASPLVLRRAAESELAAGRNDNAGALAREALARAPFDVRALRVVGLSEARAGRVDRADDILTLAGNWSLRDDPAHAWLVDRRLRRGDYASSFAHADTLVRRRGDIRPEVFNLFTLAGTEDPNRALPVIASLLAADPPWRLAYLGSLDEGQELQLAANLALLLEEGGSPLSNPELQRLYRTLLSQGQIDALRTVRDRLNRPPANVAVASGDFSDAEAPDPFQWRLGQKAGVAAEIVADDADQDNLALRVDYDGYASARIAEQLTLLAPGSYRFTAAARVEAGAPATRLVWTLTCLSGGSTLLSVPGGAQGAPQNNWAPISASFTVPEYCVAQWLRLETRAADRRVSTVAWYDQIAIARQG